jgi:hypothetical protein
MFLENKHERRMQTLTYFLDQVSDLTKKKKLVALLKWILQAKKDRALTLFGPLSKLCSLPQLRTTAEQNTNYSVGLVRGKEFRE